MNGRRRPAATAAYAFSCLAGIVAIFGILLSNDDDWFAWVLAGLCWALAALGVTGLVLLARNAEKPPS